MPLLSYNSALPLDLFDVVRSICNSMVSLLWYATALVAAIAPTTGVAGQYQLGLGVLPAL